MLGDALLVAPVFREDGVAEYYLPKGRWTHLLSGATICGGSWQKDVYDYFSLPLYVRENTLLAIGANEKRPDYDYMDGISLRLYQPCMDTPAICRIVNTKGEIVNIAQAVRTDYAIHLMLERKAEKEIPVTVFLEGKTRGGSIPAGQTSTIMILETEG
jgi:alpha-D-xyloside xylohydrolase